MRERIRTRLDELRVEFERGEEELHNLVAQEARLRETLLRISGAIQILRELINDDEVTEGVGGVSVSPTADTLT